MHCHWQRSSPQRGTSQAQEERCILERQESHFGQEAYISIVKLGSSLPRHTFQALWKGIFCQQFQHQPLVQHRLTSHKNYSKFHAKLYSWQTTKKRKSEKKSMHWPIDLVEKWRPTLAQCEIAWENVIGECDACPTLPAKQPQNWSISCQVWVSRHFVEQKRAVIN